MTSLIRLCRNVFQRERVERDLDQEMTAHLGLLIDERIAAGLSPTEARRTALLEVGGVEAIKDQVRDVRAGAIVDGCLRDARHGLRLLRRNPVFAFTAIVSLAIGIGANTTMFTVANALLFADPTAVLSASRLVDIGTTFRGAGFGTNSYANYVDIRDRVTTLNGVYAYNLFPAAFGVGVPGSTEIGRLFGLKVSPNYFSVLGTVPVVGRFFDSGDAVASDARSIVLSYDYWTRRFSRDLSVVGHTLILDGHPHTIVGVAPLGFHGTGIRSTDVWFPLNVNPGASRASASLLLGGRLAPGSSVRQADAELHAIGQSLQQ
jgi:hypothetical protein